MTDPTGDPFAQFDAAAARLESIAAAARANTASATVLSEEARSATATVRSPKGEVTVTSRVGGVISSIDFTVEALALSPADLSRLTVETVARAQHAAATRFADAASEQFGPGSGLAEGLRADADRAFPLPDGGGLQY